MRMRAMRWMNAGRKGHRVGQRQSERCIACGLHFRALWDVSLFKCPCWGQ